MARRLSEVGAQATPIAMDLIDIERVTRTLDLDQPRRIGNNRAMKRRRTR